jgi:hypothetical protein
VSSPRDDGHDTTDATHGWSDRVLADVVGLVALNQLTGAFNLVAGLEPATLADAPAL